MTEPTPDEAATGVEHWLTQHPGRAYAARFPVAEINALLAERKHLLHRLANPCDGEDCETGGDAHCHMCPEAAENRLLAAVKRVRELVSWGVPIGPETLQRALDGEVLEAPDPLNLPTYAWGESVTWNNGRILVPLNSGDATVADMELDEDGAQTLADMLTDAATHDEGARSFEISHEPLDPSTHAMVAAVTGGLIETREVHAQLEDGDV